MKDAYETLAAIKKNMADVQAVLSAWAGRPLLTRKPSHTYLPDEFDEEHKSNLAARYAEISTSPAGRISPNPNLNLLLNLLAGTPRSRPRASRSSSCCCRATAC